LQDAIVLAYIEQLAHARDDVGLADRLFLTDGKGVVTVRFRSEGLGNEAVARNGAHGLQDTRLAHASREQLFDHLLAGDRVTRGPSAPRDQGERSHEARGAMAGWFVRSMCSGETDTNPCSTAAWSQAGSSRQPVGLPPIQ